MKEMNYEPAPDRTTIFTKRMDPCKGERGRFKALEVLMNKNLSCMQKIGKVALGLRPYQVTSGQVIKVADSYCRHLDVPTEIKMLSLELFERFMISLFQEMVNLNSEMTYRLYTEKAEHFDKNWQMVFDSAPIYLVACIHVSTKFENRDVALASPRCTVKYLKKFGYIATEADLMAAEMKVFSAINYDLYIITRFNAVEDLICTRRDPFFLQIADLIFSKAIELMEMLMKNHRQIFDEVFDQLGIKLTRFEKLQCSKLQQAEYDAVWVGASVIVASVKLIQLKNLSKESAEKLSTLVRKELAEDLTDIRTEQELGVFASVLQRKFTSLGFH